MPCRLVTQAERVNLDTGTSELVSIDSWPGAFGHSATLVSDHEVLIAGGVTDAVPVDELRLLDLTTMQVTSVGTLDTPRAYHSATLLADGRVALWGGSADGVLPEQSGVIIDHETRSTSGIFSTEPEAGSLFVAASYPADGATDVPQDLRVALRFSRPVRLDSRLVETVHVSGSGGAVPVRVVAAEGGRLLFVAPQQPLEPGTSYMLTIDGLYAATDDLFLGSFAISFTTRAHESAPRRGDDEVWNPFEHGQFQEWRTNRPDSPWQRLPRLKAAPGVTALAGQVLRLNGAPLARVTLEVAGHTTTTDDTGRFLLRVVDTPTGWEELWIDGRSANRPGTTYGTFEVAVRVTSGETSVLPYTIWMPKIDTAHQVTIGSPTQGEVVITTPTIPGLELRLPPQTVIRDHDGQVVRQVSITPIPLDRTPFPLPAGVEVPLYFTIQPGGAYVHIHGGGGGYKQGARLIYPNYKGLPPGSTIDFWHYSPEVGRGWYVYGPGAVSSDGRQLVPEAGVSIREFTGAMAAPPSLAALLARVFGGPSDGDPVDLGTGLFIMENTDLILPDILPIVLRRTYRQNDTRSRSFGIGATHLYDMFLVGNTSPYTYFELILPDGARIHFDRISPGTGYADAVYEHTSSPTSFFKSRITWNGFGWDLTKKDGSRISFRDGFMATLPGQAAATRMQDRYGNAIVLTRNHLGRLTRIRAPSGRAIELTYDGTNRVTQARDNSGRTVQYTYDASGRLWKVTDPSGGVTEYTYDTSHRLLTVKDARGIVYLTNEYDAAGRVIMQTQADNTTYHFTYTLDGSGKITETAVTNPRGVIRRATFNAAGYVTSDTRAVGQAEQQTASYEWQAGTNLLLAATDPMGRRTSFVYDSFGNVTSATRLADTPDAVMMTFSYEPTFQQVATVTDPLSHTTTFGYDSQGRLTSVQDQLAHQTLMTYDANGRILSVTDPVNETATFGYDGGDLVRTTDPLGRTTTRTFDTAGRLLTATNPLGQSVQYEYNPLNQLTKITDALANTTTLTYDPNGNLLTLTDARGKTTTWTYDAMDRAVTRTDPLSRQETFTYDVHGNLLSWTDRKNQVTTYAYDGLDRQTFVGFGTTGTPPTYASTITTSYDAGSRPLQIVDSVGGTIGRTYDLLDRLTQETTPDGTVSYAYDAAGRRTAMTVAGQPGVAYTYDDADRLTSLVQGTLTVALAYDPAGRRTSVTLPNGVVQGYAYDSASSLTGITYSHGASTLGTLTYGYDAAGRRTSVDGTFARTGLPAALTSATYDDANQIATWSGVPFTYDANGNLLTDGVHSYTWNARNELASVSGPVAASFAYDGVGRRRSKTVGGITTQFLHDGLNLLQELAGGSPVANLLMGLGLDELFTRTDGEGGWNYLTDGLGSSMALADGAGAVQTQYTYEPFGATMMSGASTTNTLGFTGREADSTGLFFFRTRYYDARLQRFVSEDPLQRSLDQHLIEGFDRAANMYTFAANAPTIYTAPFVAQSSETPPPKGPPPISLPPGHKWRPVPPDRPGGREKWVPDPRIKTPKGSQPQASWDGKPQRPHAPHWDYDLGDGSLRRHIPPAPSIPGLPWRLPFPMPVIVDPCVIEPTICQPPLSTRKA